MALLAVDSCARAARPRHERACIAGRIAEGTKETGRAHSAGSMTSVRGHLGPSGVQCGAPVWESKQGEGACAGSQGSCQDTGSALQAHLQDGRAQ